MNRIHDILNVRMISYLLGFVLIFESFFMILDVSICFIYDTSSIKPVSVSALITFIAGILPVLLFKKRISVEPGIKDSFIIVTLSWIVLSLFGSLPFLLSHSIIHLTDAFFESVSGFTTTGSSILTDVESLPRGILFWRSETHWIGGLGIIVLMLTIFPYFKVGGMHLFSAESSVVVFERLKPRLIDTAKRLWLVYLILTASEVILLSVGEMDFFDSMCHAFGTVATGGFSTKNASLMNSSSYTQYIIILFMFLSGINFALHYFFFTGNYSRVFRNEEFKAYTLILIFAGLAVTFHLYFRGNRFESALRHAFFQVTSILTATGFSSSDYLQWPVYSKVIIFMLMLIGGSAGSTSGGIKVVRHVVAIKRLGMHFKNLLHPQMIKPVKYNRQVLESNQVNLIINFIITYLIIICIGTFFLTLMGLDFDTSAGSVATTLGGIGPGFGMTGPASHFAYIPVAAKWFLSSLMILGRLELFTVLVIFHPSFWKI